MTDQPRVLSAMLRVPIGDVHPNPRNIRRRPGTPEELQELAASIRQVGILQPLTVQRRAAGGFEVLAGHRRLAAAKLANLETVDVVLRRDHLPDEELQLMLVENCRRKDLDPIDRAHALSELARMCGSKAEVARRVGLTQASVSMAMMLGDLREAEKRAVRDGRLGVTDAREIVKGRRGQRTDPERGWHFTVRHPLASRARAACTAAAHTTARKFGRVACGACWEQVIREDERATMGEPR